MLEWILNPYGIDLGAYVVLWVALLITVPVALVIGVVKALRAGATMTVEYVCEYCGHAGRTTAADSVDEVQCRDCGELVVPVPPGSGLIDGEDD